MLLAETNKAKRLLHLTFIGRVQPQDLEQSRGELASLLEDLPAGFHLITDLTHLESMDLACEAEIARFMELCDHKGISSVIRVIPDPYKDIGFNILGAFHYDRRVQVATCQSLAEALQSLS